MKTNNVIGNLSLYLTESEDATKKSQVSEDSRGLKSCNTIKLSRASLKESEKIPSCYLLSYLLLTLFWCLFLYCMKTSLEQADRNAGAENHSSSRTKTDSSPSLLMCLQAHPSWVLQRKTAYLIIHILLQNYFQLKFEKEKSLESLEARALNGRCSCVLRL